MSALTVARLANAKFLPEEFLLSLGLRDSAEGVAIPYRDEHGNLLFERMRLSLDGSRRFLQPAGVHLAPYGLDRLEDARKREFLIIVEGESDFWTLTYTGVPCLGLPGSGAARTLQANYLPGIKQIFAIREPGRGGTTFVTGLAQRLSQLEFTGEAFEVSCAPYKDPSECYCDGPEVFGERFMGFLNHTTPIMLNDALEIGRGLSGFRPVSEYLAEMKTAGEKKWLWTGILREGEVSILAGRAMAGKSTFACAVARALTAGTPLLERTCRETTVGYMALERNGSTVAKLFGKWGLGKILFLHEVPLISGDQLANYLEAQIAEHRLEAVIVDHLQNLVRVNDANDYARVSLALEPFQKIAKRTGVHMMLLHHQGKTRREGEIDVMGSEAFRAAADAIMEATRSGDRHYIRANIRGEADLPRTLVNIALQTGEAEGLDARQVEINEAQRAIFIFLEGQPDWQRIEAIRDGVEIKLSVVCDSLKAGYDAGIFARRGIGKKGNPFFYQTPEFVSRDSDGKAGNESQAMQDCQQGERDIRFLNSAEMNSETEVHRETNRDVTHIVAGRLADKEWIE